MFKTIQNKFSHKMKSVDRKTPFNMKLLVDNHFVFKIGLIFKKSKYTKNLKNTLTFGYAYIYSISCKTNLHGTWWMQEKFG
jgi:hypothetical protein